MRYLRRGERERGGGGVHPLDWGDCSASGALANPCSRAVIAVNLATTFTESGYLDLPPPFWLNVWLYRTRTHFFKGCAKRNPQACSHVFAPLHLDSSVAPVQHSTASSNNYKCRAADKKRRLTQRQKWIISCCWLAVSYSTCTVTGKMLLTLVIVEFIQITGLTFNRFRHHIRLYSIYKLPAHKFWATKKKKKNVYWPCFVLLIETEIIFCGLELVGRQDDPTALHLRHARTFPFMIFKDHNSYKIPFTNGF